MNQRSSLQDTLINYLESGGNLDPRFKDIKCLSFVENQVRQGALSIVFTAYDVVENKPVIIKIHDPDHMTDDYRLAAFKREPVVLSKLMGKQRCLQLVFGPGTFNWIINTNGVDLPIKLGYFVAEWIPDEVDQYFLNHRRYSALDKLKVFKSAILAVNSIHRAGIAHRDLKADNLRGRSDNSDNIVEVIPVDFGTAVHSDDKILVESSNYPDTVGAPAFSAPEAFVGLRSDREVGSLTDIYAMGALLYKLFNDDHYYFAAVDRNVHYQQVRAYISSKLIGTKSHQERLAIWKKEMPSLRGAVIPPSIEGRGTSLPPSISQIINPLHKQMVLFDFQERLNSLEYINERLDIAIRVLENQALEDSKLIRKKRLRELRLQKNLKKQVNLNKYLERNKRVCSDV